MPSWTRCSSWAGSWRLRGEHAEVLTTHSHVCKPPDRSVCGVVFLWFFIGGIAHFAATDDRGAPSSLPLHPVAARRRVGQRRLRSCSAQARAARGRRPRRCAPSLGLIVSVDRRLVTPGARSVMLQQPELFHVPYWALVLRLARCRCVAARVRSRGALRPFRGAKRHSRGEMKSCRRQFGSATVVLAALLGACTTTARPDAWDDRLRGDALVLLGEVHDNAQQHRLRLAALQRAFAAGWRPAIAMEQFDRERQADIDRARRERPDDARHVIDAAARSGGDLASGWNWAFYQPFVKLALRYDVPLIAANLSNADTSKITRGGYGAVFSAAAIAALGLDVPVAAEVQAAQEREIDAGHCHALPPSLWPRMARAQLARDAVMADVIRRADHGSGVVLLAGNGHVRRDIGVPQLARRDEEQGVRRRLSRDRRRVGDPRGLRCGGANGGSGTGRSLRGIQEARAGPCRDAPPT